MDLFYNAKIVLGPHGAGLTNMVWTQNGTAVIEFPLSPHANRNMGMLAQSASLDFYMLPQISCQYYLKYTLDDDGIAALIRLLKHIIDKRGLQYLYQAKDEL